MTDTAEYLNQEVYALLSKIEELEYKVEELEARNYALSNEAFKEGYIAGASAADNTLLEAIENLMKSGGSQEFQMRLEQLYDLHRRFTSEN